MAKINKGGDTVWYDSGKGKIYVIRAPIRGMEERLFDQTVAMVDALGFSIQILSVDTGKHAPRSRHYTGRAEDITDVHPYGGGQMVCTLENPYARLMVEWFMANGFQAGRENGPYDAILLGPAGTPWNKTKVPHEHHAHASIFKP
jgi:hypothetical protein